MLQGRNRQFRDKTPFRARILASELCRGMPWTARCGGTLAEMRYGLRCLQNFYEYRTAPSSIRSREPRFKNSSRSTGIVSNENPSRSESERATARTHLCSIADARMRLRPAGARLAKPSSASSACAPQILFWFVLDLPKMRHELGVAVPRYFRRIPLALEMPLQAGDQEDGVSCSAVPQDSAKSAGTRSVRERNLGRRGASVYMCEQANTILRSTAIGNSEFRSCRTKGGQFSPPPLRCVPPGQD